MSKKLDWGSLRIDRISLPTFSKRADIHIELQLSPCRWREDLEVEVNRAKYRFRALYRRVDLVSLSHLLLVRCHSGTFSTLATIDPR